MGVKHLQINLYICRTEKNIFTNSTIEQESP